VIGDSSTPSHSLHTSACQVTPHTKPSLSPPSVQMSNPVQTQSLQLRGLLVPACGRVTCPARAHPSIELAVMLAGLTCRTCSLHCIDLTGVAGNCGRTGGVEIFHLKKLGLGICEMGDVSGKVHCGEREDIPWF
jgi:hypothetical protein